MPRIKPYILAFDRHAPLVARMLLAICFLFSALGKIPATPSFYNEVAMSKAAGLPAAYLLVTVAFLLEVSCSIMLIIGWYARVAAFLLAGFVFLIGVTFVRDLGDQMQLIIFFSCLQYIAGLLYIAVYGARTFAIRPDAELKVTEGNTAI